MKRRKGRRPGNQDTRGSILAVAREVFAEHGYDKASIREIASKAHVDPSLVLHYFASKDKLFLASVQLPFDPDRVVPKVFAGDPDQVAQRLVRIFLAVWEGPISGPAIASVVRSAASHKKSQRLVRDLFSSQIVRRVIDGLGDVVEPSEIPMRASLISSQLFGLAFARYIFKIEPLATADKESVVATIAPTLHRYLFEDLPTPGEDSTKAPR